MNNLMPLTTTATDLQRNYKKVIKMVKKAKEPVTVLSNNRPEVVVMDYEAFASLSKVSRQKKDSLQKKSNFSEFFGKWSKKEAEEFDKVIEDAFEQINPEGWK